MHKLIAVMMALVMSLSLAACGGGVPEEKLAKMDAVVVKLDTLIKDTKVEIEKTNNAGYQDVQSYYDTNILAVQQMEEEYEKMKRALTDNRSKMSEQQVDTAIVELEKMEQQLTNVKNSAIEEVSAIEEAINETEAAAQASASSITIPVEIINNTGVDFYALAMSPANQETWGDNLLTEVLANGESGVTEMTFTQDTFVWDILVQDKEENQLVFFEVDFSVAPTENAKLMMKVQDGNYVAVFMQ